MKKLILLSLAVSSFIFAQTPKVYWVDVHNGNDGNNGLASSTAFKTIQYVFLMPIAYYLPALLTR